MIEVFEAVHPGGAGLKVPVMVGIQVIEVCANRVNCST